VLRTATGRRLVGLGAHPLDEARLVECAHAHQHAAHRAVATDPVLAALGQRVLDHRHVDRVEDDDGIGFHAQRRGCVDPVTVPARRAQLGEHLGGVVAALCGDDDLAALERVEVIRVLEFRLVFRHHRGRAASVGRREEQRLDEAEIALGLHAVHQDGADHAAPSDQSYEFHVMPFPVFDLPRRLASPG